MQGGKPVKNGHMRKTLRETLREYGEKHAVLWRDSSALEVLVGVNERDDLAVHDNRSDAVGLRLSDHCQGTEHARVVGNVKDQTRGGHLDDIGLYDHSVQRGWLCLAGGHDVVSPVRRPRNVHRMELPGRILNKGE
jgi:hypothetical protein